MRIAFLVMSVLCAFLISVLVFVFQTGRVPFKPAPVPVVQEKAKQDEPLKTATVFSEQQAKTVEELFSALNAERQAVAAKTAELTAKEEEVRVKEAAYRRIESELQDLQSKLEKSYVDLEAAERANMKRLAEVCSKMDPAGASAMLRKIDVERAAVILSMINDRAAAAILDATVTDGEKGTTTVSNWVDTIRRMKAAKKNANPVETGV
jgi:flagellar motility protein MotE (MotC chaperone)